MFKSIRWKFVIIYFILVLIAMLISGIFIIDEINKLHISEASLELSGIKEFLMADLQLIDDLSEDIVMIDYIIGKYQQGTFGIDENVSIIDGNSQKIIATTETGASERLRLSDDIELVTSVFVDGNTREKVRKDEFGNRIMIQVYPIIYNGEKTGILFLKRDLAKVDETIKEIKDVIIKAILFASLATIILGFIISKSISSPIRALIQKAVLMSKGDFDHYVEVKSNDEIGELSETFNYLTRKLKKSLREISLEKTKVEAIVNHMTDGVIAVDNNHSIIHMNPKAIELLGLGSDAYFEIDFDNLISNISEELMYEYITNHNEDWKGSKLISIGESIVKFNYAPYYAPYVDDEKEKVGIVYVLQDFTESEKLDSMRRDFVANVSHELKTPLTSIKSYTETLLDGFVDDEETRESFLKVIDSEADRMSRLVKDLLQLSNFDSNTIIYYKEYNNFLELIKKSIKQLTVSAKKKNITIKLITTNEQMVCLFDLHRLEQVFINIISNAVKYTNDNGLIEIHVFEEEESIIARVIDNGIGIPASDLNNIFDRFYRVDKARTRNMGGTGLGLSIAKEIVKGHEGTISIESDFGKGTTVLIQIPKNEIL